jgi:hypothetical protein
MPWSPKRVNTPSPPQPFQEMRDIARARSGRELWKVRRRRIIERTNAGSLAAAHADAGEDHVVQAGWRLQFAV